MSAPRPRRCVVLGVGNVLRSDDGVGCQAARALRAGGAGTPALPTEVIEAGASILHAVDCVEGATHLLVLDAVRAGGGPGDICEFDGYASEPDARPCPHTMGVRSALALVAPGRRPGRFRVLGVEPGSVDFGMALTPAVEAAMPALLARAHGIVSDWDGERERDE